MSNMDFSLVNKINEEIKGYYLFNDYQKLFCECTSINEMIHVLHSYFVNCEDFYNKGPLIHKYEDEHANVITLYGFKSALAEQTFNNLKSAEIDSSILSILSINNNQLLIMARDLGHATTIEITIEDDKAFVNYFIPKIRQLKMVIKEIGLRECLW